jgi:hypothetical protein
MNMQWYHYVAAFFSGAFLTNGVPHFVKGVSGDPFPTPFSSPPGKGLSSPLTNVLWALLNLFVGYVLLKASGLDTDNTVGMLVFFAGVALMGVMGGISFAGKAKEI